MILPAHDFKKKDTTLTDVPNESVIPEPILPAEAKKEKFLLNPDQFEDLENVLCSCKRDGAGNVLVLLNVKSVQDCWIVKGAIETNVNMAIGQFLQKQAQTALIKKGIVAPGNGGGPRNPNFLPNLRKFLKR